MHGGLVGYLGYDVVREIERLGPPPSDDLGLPDAIVSVVGQVVAFDHWKSRASSIDNVVLDGSRGDARSSSFEPRLRARARQHRRTSCATSSARSRSSCLRRRDRGERLDPARSTAIVSSETYQAAVETAKEYIRAGDAFQIVLSQRFDLELGVEPFDVYRVLRQVNPSPYMFFLRQGGVSVVGASPEPLVQLLDGRVVSRPIAGTRAEGRIRRRTDSRRRAHRAPKRAG